MAMSTKQRKTKRSRKGGKKKTSRPRTRVPKGLRTVPEWASCTEIRSLAPQSTNLMYHTYDVALEQFPRASIIAQGYQYFRIKRITYVIKPLADTFIAGGGVTVPNLYYMIDRKKELQFATSASDLKRLGATPKRLDDKNVYFSYTPSVLIPVLDVQNAVSNSFNQYRLMPWLATRDTQYNTSWIANSTDHLGASYIVENAGGTTIQYSVDKIVEFEFKKPAYNFTDEGVPAGEEVFV